MEQIEIYCDWNDVYVSREYFELYFSAIIMAAYVVQNACSGNNEEIIKLHITGTLCGNPFNRWLGDSPHKGSVMRGAYP